VKAREYRVEVAAIVRGAWPHAITLARLRVSIIAHPPDRRKRDLDNILKPLLDVLAHADVYKDDCQIDALTIERAEIIKGGEVIVLIEELPDSS
jgi:crossover junction endodeoxyribonuclease RusA